MDSCFNLRSLSSCTPGNRVRVTFPAPHYAPRYVSMTGLPDGQFCVKDVQNEFCSAESNDFGFRAARKMVVLILRPNL
jgi:hypothetical protein